MFLPGDIYTASGSLKLYHCWTDKVTKYDSSSFYNWEQDNLPIYDLEERTFYLWEQLGYPTSAIPGVALVVSADAPDAAIGCNKNIFRTVSAAVEALPQIINFPIIIEIANFGELGDLILNNHKFGPRGSLEIINRNFSKQEYSFSGILTNSGTNPQMSATYFAGTNPRNYVGSFERYLGANPAYLIKTSPMQGFLDSSCLSISAAVFSGTKDARLSGVGGLSPKLNGYVSVFKPVSNYNKSTLIVDSKNSTQPYNDDVYGIAFTPYALNAYPEDDVDVKDASTVDYLNNGSLLYSNNYDGGQNVSRGFNGLYYGNKLSKIYINNCDGPIFIRNFFLDGKGHTVTTNQYGVEVNNSPNIYLENIVSTRFRKAGFYFNNASVNLLRSCVANRIYDFDSSNRRITGNFSTRRIGITYNDSSSYLEIDQAAGLVANNSFINFSSTRDWEYARYAENLNSDWKATPNAYHIIEFNDNANGVILNNSIMIGGDSRRSSTDELAQIIDETIFDFNSNVNCGLIANNSKISLNGLIRLRENLKGMEINSSELEVETIEAVYNQTLGIELNNSVGVYNKNLKKYHSTGTLRPHLLQRPAYFLGNGTHLSLNASKLLPQTTSSMELRYCDMRFESPIGSNTSGVLTESIRVDKNSELCLISPRIVRDDTHGLEGTSKKGSEINCLNNSKVSIRGTRYFPTRIVGPDSRNKQKNIAAIAANQNSIVDINGPTVIAQFGIDLLADKNSTINITPPKSELDGVLDVSSINLNDSANHTMVELHSTRSCIVVDNQSTLNMKDLGSYRTRWDVTGTFNSFGPDYGGVNDTAFNTTYVSGGSMQFYPNPNAAGTTNAAITVTGSVYNPFTKYNNGYGAIHGLNNSVLTFSSVTFGGMCVRALNNSVVNAHNVNFPCGWWNASAPYYDKSITFDSGGACFRPFIWNIADSSQLKASFLSVSGLFPRLAGYVGPYGYWKGADSNAYYGAPSSTPDTSSISILDIYGANPSGTAFTNVTATNYGPFRLYFGVNPFVNSLTELDGSGGVEIIKQIYSQGYQPSASLLCSGSPSAIYKMALIRNSNGVVSPSGFYYGSGVTDTAGHMRVLLDESSAETFANAKHCAAGRSGNSKLVSIYYPYTIARYGDTYSTKGIASVNTFDIERDN